MNPIRVVTVIHGYYPRVGGAERQMQFLAPRLRERGIDLIILTRRYDRSLKSYEEIDGVPVYRLPVPGPKPVASLVFTLYALFTIFRLRPNMIHAHEFISPSTVALLSKRWFGVPFVVTLHRSGPLGDVQKLSRKTSGKMRLNELREKTSSFVLISREIEEELKGIGIPSERMTMITNGVDTNVFAPLSSEERIPLRQKLGLPEDALVGIYTGRLAPEKRVDQLISVWNKLRVEFPKAELLILGQGTEEAKLRQMVGAGVRFLGGVDNVTPYLQASDLYVLPSIAEGLSVAMLEAMSCGVPALVTDVGGAREVITHGENGWIIQPDQVDQLEGAIRELLAKKELRTKIGDAGRSRVLEAFSVKIAVEKLFDLYHQVVGEAHNG